MKKYFIMFVAVLTMVAVTMPAFALEVKYGGLLRVRWFSNNNILDGQDTQDTVGLVRSPFDDNQNYLDERMRMFFTFVSSENLRAVIAFEQDVLWGDSRSKLLDGHRDNVGLELKHAYLDFAIPGTTVRTKVGLQPIALLTGWIVDEDFTAIMATGNFEPIMVTLGYISERNGATRATTFNADGTVLEPGRTFGVTAEDENIDDFVATVSYASGPISASMVGLYQNGHDARQLREARANGTNIAGIVDPSNPGVLRPFNAGAPFGDSDNLFDLGLTFSYKQDFWNVTLNFVKNFGSFERSRFNPDPTVLAGTLQAADVDYTGWMIEGIGNYFCGPLTLSLGAFFTSGDDNFADDEMSAFVYPLGATHAWSEIMGGGSLDTTINDSAALGAGDNFGVRTRGNYATYNSVVHGPSNLWTINAGAAYQVLEGTKLTFNYYYAATSEDVVSGFNPLTGVNQFDNTVGHELNLYVDQKVVDKLMLRLVGAYLFADDAFTVLNTDDGAYEVGAVLSWSF